MPRTAALDKSLISLLDQSSRPIYAVDTRHTLVYCNKALATWLGLTASRILGRRVEYHSAANDASRDDVETPLTDLCPPPRALAGEACGGTISCVGREGRLIHRQAEFIPLGRPSQKSDTAGTDSAPQGVLVMLADRDMSHQELATELSAEPTADELHRAIRRFRREQAARYAAESILGSSSAMRKVHAQIAAAAAADANVLVIGREGSGATVVARAIHYQAGGESPSKLVPLDCEIATDELLRRSLDSIGLDVGPTRQRPTLLLENFESLQPGHQSHLLAGIQQKSISARIIATMTGRTTESEKAGASGGASGESNHLDPALLDAISTITIELPRLADRLEDLPLLAQFNLEACNRRSAKQVGAIRGDAIDLLMLYSWPGEVEQLKAVIAAAHEACQTHQITPADLPPLIHHASKAATHVRREPERIVLEDLLAVIEKEAITRALAQSGGNKSEASDLLGMTRPRFYRRLVQLGLVEASAEPAAEQPEFIERDPEQES